MRIDTTTRTEHDTDIYVPNSIREHATHVEVALYGGGIQADDGGAVWLSLTPLEARWLANRLLDRADTVEEVLPHGNC